MCFSEIKACMGFVYLLVFVRKYESNLPTNICTTVGKQTQWYREKYDLLSETTFLWQYGVFFLPTLYML